MKTHLVIPSFDLIMKLDGKYKTPISSLAYLVEIVFFFKLS